MNLALRLQRAVFSLPATSHHAPTLSHVPYEKDNHSGFTNTTLVTATGLSTLTWCLWQTAPRTCCGIIEVLQSPGLVLKVFVLRRLKNHLTLVQLLHKFGFCTGLGLILLSKGTMRAASSGLPDRGIQENSDSGTYISHSEKHVSVLYTIPSQSCFACNFTADIGTPCRKDVLTAARGS